MKTTARFLFPVMAALFWTVSPLSTRAFEAHDDGNGAPYAPAESWIGINGGTNFTVWTVLSDTTAGAFSSDFRDGSAAGGENEGDFSLGADGGEVVVGRDLVDGGNPMALESGEFSVLSWITPGTENVFLGFSVYDANHSNELLCWGVSTEGVGYILDGEYHSLEDGFSRFYEYSLTWRSLAGAEMQFTLYGREPGMTGGTEPTEWNGTNIVVMGNSVGGIAVVARNGVMSFDQLSVRGDTEVPEPGTLGLLAVGLAGLAARRWRK